MQQLTQLHLSGVFEDYTLTPRGSNLLTPRGNDAVDDINYYHQVFEYLETRFMYIILWL